jgi:hypothetical protein
VGGKPLALTRDEGRAILVLADPGGEPLDGIIERDRENAPDLASLLHLAINMAAALGHSHRRGLIHKDVKPGNILVNASGHVWLTGFGIASRLPRERQASAPPEVIAGTLAYLSPEQTGRMNRSIDTRSDLYSLGVTLYQLFTGVLPFVASDPLEWVHCHVARQPAAPAERSDVPEPLSDIVMRLLAKNAEDRYQTASGLEADLRRCLQEWQRHGRIDPFPLGTADSPDRLLIPEKLYGRESEVDALLAASLAHLIADSLHCGLQSAEPLGQLIHGKTAGNPFFAIQFFQALVEERLILFDHESAGWRWEPDAIRAKGYTDNVVDLMADKLNRLPAAARRAARQLACIGHSAESTMLSAVIETPEQEVEAALREALHLELIVRAEDSYRFAHDRIQEAAYSLTPEEMRPEAHLRIGRLLLASIPPEKREEAIFEIVNQFNRGAELITAENERCQVAEINLVAGKRAKASTAYDSALKFFLAGQALLTDESWERRHDLTFELELQRAECEFLTGEVTGAAERVARLRSRALDTVELAAATCLAIDVDMTLGQIGRAVEGAPTAQKVEGLDRPDNNRTNSNTFARSIREFRVGGSHSRSAANVSRSEGAVVVAKRGEPSPVGLKRNLQNGGGRRDYSWESRRVARYAERSENQGQAYVDQGTSSAGVIRLGSEGKGHFSTGGLGGNEARRNSRASLGKG